MNQPAPRRDGPRGPQSRSQGPSRGTPRGRGAAARGGARQGTRTGPAKPNATPVSEPKPPRDQMTFDFAAIKPIAPPAWLAERAGAMGVEFDASDVERLGVLLACIQAGNERVNLTAITDSEQAWQRHVLDSLTLMGVLADLPEGSRVLDIGTGAGLPGLPLAICMPHLKFTLLDGTAKKIAFVQAAAARVGVKNVEAVAGRAEQLGHDIGVRRDVMGKVIRDGGWREQFDAVVARAVGQLDTLAEMAVPFAKVGGVVALIKGAQAQQEVEAASKTLHEIKVVVNTIAATPTGQIVILEKRVATPRLYPRAERVNAAKHKKK
ncbi:MAG: 16S rRNA (guanine(527)-N(7))-methyltransferase RsmG [Phycisphaerae bacterium]